MDPKVLERLGLCPEDTTPNTIESSPPVLEPSKDESRFEDETRKPNPLRRLRTRSPDIEPSETAHLLSVHGRITNCFSAIYNCYKDFVVKFRNSVFVIIMQLVLCSIPISAIVMGVYYSKDCPKVHFLHIFGAVIGAIGLILMAFWMYVTYNSLNETPSSSRQQLLLGAAFFVLFILTIIDAVFVIRMWAGFDSWSNQYCNKTFYSCAFYRDCATILIVSLATLIYIPGNRHVLCCQNCSIRSPPNAIYNSI